MEHGTLAECLKMQFLVYVRIVSQIFSTKQNTIIKHSTSLKMFHPKDKVDTVRRNQHESIISTSYILPCTGLRTHLRNTHL